MNTYSRDARDARRMDEQFRQIKASDKQFAAKVETESENLDKLVAQVRKSIEDGTITGTLLLSKITRLTGCEVPAAEKIKAIIKGECL